MSIALQKWTGVLVIAAVTLFVRALDHWFRFSQLNVTGMRISAWTLPEGQGWAGQLAGWLNQYWILYGLCWVGWTLLCAWLFNAMSRHRTGTVTGILVGLVSGLILCGLIWPLAGWGDPVWRWTAQTIAVEVCFWAVWGGWLWTTMSFLTEKGESGGAAADIPVLK